MSKFYVDYNTGAGNFEFDGSLENAIKSAEADIAYTQQPVTIHSNGAEVARLPWWDVEANEDDVVTADYGQFGFYGEWSIQ